MSYPNHLIGSTLLPRLYFPMHVQSKVPGIDPSSNIYEVISCSFTVETSCYRVSLWSLQLLMVFELSAPMTEGSHVAQYEEVSATSPKLISKTPT